MIRDVPASLVPDLWPGVEKHIIASLREHPFLTADGVLQLLLAGRAQLILVTHSGIDGAAVLEIVEYPARRVGNVLALGGERGFNRRNFPALAEHLERWCLEKRCDSMMLLGRLGWSRIATQRGGKTLPLLLAWKPLTR